MKAVCGLRGDEWVLPAVLVPSSKAALSTSGTWGLQKGHQLGFHSHKHGWNYVSALLCPHVIMLLKETRQVPSALFEE